MFYSHFLVRCFVLSASKEDLADGGGMSLDLQTTIKQVNILQFRCSQGNTEREYLSKNKPESFMLTTELAIWNSFGMSVGYLSTNNIIPEFHLAFFRIN